MEICAFSKDRMYSGEKYCLSRGISGAFSFFSFCHSHNHNSTSILCIYVVYSLVSFSMLFSFPFHHTPALEAKSSSYFFSFPSLFSTPASWQAFFFFFFNSYFIFI